MRAVKVEKTIRLNGKKKQLCLLAMNLDIDPLSVPRERNDKQQPWKWKI